jgi:F0F1-type ATP synthase membrane subunit b/b'
LSAEGGIEFFSETSLQLGFLIQIATLIGFLIPFVAFLHRSITGKINKTIDEKIKPVAEAVVKIEGKLDTMKDDTIKEIKVKEELDRGRFSNIQQSQEFVKEKLEESVKNSEEFKKKLEAHLVEAALFIGETKTRISLIETTIRASSNKDALR